MKQFAMLVFGLLFICATSHSAVADHKKGHHAHKRQARQHARVADGVQDGTITKEEAKSLHQDQKAIHRKRLQAKADGVVTRDEKQEMQQMQNDASKDIYQEKHD